MLKIIRFTERDFREVVDTLPDAKDTILELFNFITSSNNSNIVEFVYLTVTHYNKIYMESSYPDVTYTNSLNSHTFCVGSYDLMSDNYTTDDTPLSDKYSIGLYDGLLEEIENIHGAVDHTDPETNVDYEYKLRMDLMIGVMEIVSTLSRYVENIMLGALIGFDITDVFTVTVSHDTDSLILVLTDELDK